MAHLWLPAWEAVWVMRQVWRYVLFGLGVIGIIWGIVLLFSQVWHTLIVFAVSLLCLAATRLIGREEAAVGTAAAGVSTVSEPERQSAPVGQEQAAQDPMDATGNLESLDPSTQERTAHTDGHDDPSLRTAGVMLAEELPDDEPESDEEDAW